MLKKVSTTQAVKQFSGATGVSHADAKQLLKKGGFKSSMSQEGLEKAVEKSMGIAKKEGIDLKGRNQGVQKQRERISQAIQGDSKGTKAKTTPETEKDKKLDKASFLAGVMGKKGPKNDNNLGSANILDKIHQADQPQISDTQQNNAVISGSKLTKKGTQKKDSNKFEASSNQTPGFGIQKKNSSESEPPVLQI